MSTGSILSFNYFLLMILNWFSRESWPGQMGKDLKSYLIESNSPVFPARTESFRASTYLTQEAINCTVTEHRTGGTHVPTSHFGALIHVVSPQW